MKYKIVESRKYEASNKVKEIYKSATTGVIISILLLGALFPNLVKYSSYKMTKENRSAYSTELEEYNSNIEAYAEYIKTLELNDTEIIAKLISDMWENIKGYGTPKLNKWGALELDVANSDGVGVCRNMANDISNKLNVINPKYNAHLIYCSVSDEGFYDIMDIKRHQVKEQSSTEEEEKKRSSIDEYLNANHVIISAHDPETNEIILIDPTNPGIGTFIDGKMVMFNSLTSNSYKIDDIGIKYDYKPLSDYEFAPLSEHFNNLNSLISSNLKSSDTINKLINKYGVESQDESLTKVNNIDDQEYVNQTFYR